MPLATAVLGLKVKEAGDVRITLPMLVDAAAIFRRSLPLLESWGSANLLRGLKTLANAG
jgi:hypothetical protein